MHLTNAGSLIQLNLNDTAGWPENARQMAGCPKSGIRYGLPGR